MAERYTMVPTKSFPNTFVKLCVGLGVSLVYNTTKYGGVQRMYSRERPESWKLSQNYVISWDIPKELKIDYFMIPENR